MARVRLFAPHFYYYYYKYQTAVQAAAIAAFICGLSGASSLPHNAFRRSSVGVHRSQKVADGSEMCFEYNRMLKVIGIGQLGAESTKVSKCSCVCPLSAMLLHVHVWRNVLLPCPQARHFIYITGWSVWADLQLLRERPLGPEGAPPPPLAHSPEGPSSVVLPAGKHSHQRF